MMKEDPRYQLYKFQQKIATDKKNSAATNNSITTEMYSAVVKNVNSDTFTVDVFILDLNAEMKNVQVLMPAISQKGGRIILPQINSVVVIVMVSYMRPFILATNPILDSEVPSIHKNEIVDYTDNTFHKHTLNGDIVSMSGFRNANISKENGVFSRYNTTDSRYSRYEYNLKGINDNIGSVEYEKIYLPEESNDNSTNLDKLYNLKDKLSDHINALSSLKVKLLKNGVNKDEVLNSVSQLRSLLYNEYIDSNNIITIQKGAVLNKEIKSSRDISNITKEDIKVSEDGAKLLYEFMYKTKDDILSISVDENKNIDIKCNKIKINGKEVGLIE